MAVVGSDQITIVDLTDAYSVTLTSEAASFAADKDGKALAETAFTTQVVALRGVDAVVPTITQSAITTTGGISSATVSTSSPFSALNPGITIKISKGVALTNNVGEVDIPVVLDGGITIHKKFSVSASRTGAGGSNGADAITITVTSSNGNIFKNSDVITDLTAHVYKAGTEVTGSALSALGTIKWYKDGNAISGSTTTGIVVNGATVKITSGGVTNKATFEARLEK